MQRNFQSITTSKTMTKEDAGQNGPQSWTALPYPLRLYLVLAVPLTVACVLLKELGRRILHHSGPLSFVITDIRLGDFRAFAPIMPHLGSDQFFMTMTGGSQLFKYPPAVTFVYCLYYWLPHSEVAFYLLVIGTFLFAATGLGLALKRYGIPAGSILLLLCTTAFVAYPIWFEWVTGNAELFNFIFLGIGLFAAGRGKWVIAGACIGIAVALKITPIIFLALFFARREYRGVLASVISAAAVTFAGLCIEGTTIMSGVQHTLLGLHQYSQLCYASFDYNALNFDHSLFSLLKRFAQMVDKITSIGTVGKATWIVPMYKGYTVFVAVVALAVYFKKFRSLPYTNQLVLLTLAIIFLPPSSFDYTLISLYIGWSMLVLFAFRHRNQAVPGLAPLLGCFAVLTSPLSEFILGTTMFGAQIRAVVALAAMILTLRFPFLGET